MARCPSSRRPEDTNDDGKEEDDRFISCRGNAGGGCGGGGGGGSKISTIIAPCITPRLALSSSRAWQIMRARQDPQRSNHPP
ncbi:hypothetical protein E2C01_025317 [Portunus trituberculatus]|uniref:Uncharacterized protein n=1 Tax=Portunus trituberculatus TaxID=210409 RepID=A0A5B7EF63_PORTR|nr:hypothetical protein [Portunus trituberculatus]